MATRITSLGLAAAGLCALGLLLSQLHCAEVESGWRNDETQTDMQGGDGGDGGDNGSCYNGTATTELQLLNHCTEAEHVDRMSHLPTGLWDGKYPLP